MQASTLIEFQLRHSRWALERLIAAARELPAEALERDLGIGPGGVRENLAHTLEAIFYFAGNFAGREYAEPAGFSDGSRSLDGLAKLLEGAFAELEKAMLGELGERVKWPGDPSGFLPTPVAIAQVFDHSTLHRTQCINMLKRLGRPAPDLDPMTFFAARAGEARQGAVS